MNVGGKQLVEQNPKMSQRFFYGLDSVKFIHINKNITIWTSASELR